MLSTLRLRQNGKIEIIVFITEDVKTLISNIGYLKYFSRVCHVIGFTDINMSETDTDSKFLFGGININSFKNIM